MTPVGCNIGNIGCNMVGHLKVRYRHVTSTMANQKFADFTEFIKKTHNDALVTVKQPLAIGCLVLNVLFPGVGTAIACLKVDKAKEGLIALLMMWLMTFVFFVGWIWSIVHGVQILMKSEK